MVDGGERIVQAKSNQAHITVRTDRYQDTNTNTHTERKTSSI